MKTKKHNEPHKIDGYWTGSYMHRCGHSSDFSIPVASNNEGEGRTIGHMRRIIRRECGMDCPQCRAQNRPAGRPAQYDEPVVRVTVTVPHSVAETIKADGPLSPTIRKIVLDHYGYKA